MNKVHDDSLSQIWNKYNGLQTLLEMNEHEADRKDLEGTNYKIKSDMERLLASRQIVCMSLAPKLGRTVQHSVTLISQSARGYSEIAINIFA